MFQLLYFSSATQPFKKNELVNLLTEAKLKNADLGITGMLLYKDGNFMQIIEGEEEAVKKLYYEKICLDDRHKNLIVVLEEPVAQRMFNDWAMGFRNLDDVNIQTLSGYSQFMNRQLIPENFANDNESCLDLLKMFRENG